MIKTDPQCGQSLGGCTRPEPKFLGTVRMCFMLTFHEAEPLTAKRSVPCVAWALRRLLMFVSVTGALGKPCHMHGWSNAGQGSAVIRRPPAALSGSLRRRNLGKVAKKNG